MLFYTKKGATMTLCHITDFPNLLNYKFLWAQMVLLFTNKKNSSSHLGVKAKPVSFTPKLMLATAIPRLIEPLKSI